MAPTPVQNTPRLKYTYTTGRVEHSTLFRWTTAVAITEAAALATAFFNALSPLLTSGWRTRKLDWYPDESPNSIPVADPEIIEGLWAGVLEEKLEPRFLSFGGRGPINDKVRWTVFGAHVDTGPDYRVNVTLETALVNARNVLQAAVDGGDLATIKGNSPVVIYPYVNLGFNSYHERQARRR